MSKVFIYGLPKGSLQPKLSKVIQEVFLQSTNNLSWLSKGDTVLLKPAINSPDPYPSTTHPEAVNTIAHILEDRGARVIVGDQAGIGHVVQNKNGIVKGSTRYCFEHAGMRRDLYFVPFEEEDWEKGFYKFSSAQTKSWPNGFYITKWIKEADHIVNLPRISTHGQAGITLGFKNLVGTLREDSRLAFHLNGPFSFMFKLYSKNAHLRGTNDHKKAFFEKITEISLAVKEKLRLTLFVGSEVQTAFGPDQFMIRLGKIGLLPAHRILPETGLIFASDDQVNAEIIALAFLTYLYAQTPKYKKIAQKILLSLNGQAEELGKKSVWDNPFIKHALKVGLGDRNIKAKFSDVPDKLKKSIEHLIK